MGYPVINEAPRPWFRQDDLGRWVPTAAFIEHTLAIVGHDIGLESPSAFSLHLSGSKSLFSQLLANGGTPDPVTTAKLCGIVDGWYTGYERPVEPPLDPKDMMHLAWVRYQESRGITERTSRRRPKPAWHDGMKRWPPLLPSAPDGAPRRAMTRELSRYVLDATAIVLFPGEEWAKQRGPLAQLLGVRRRTLEMWRYGHKMHRGLVFKGLALRILVAGGNLRVYADQYGEPMWSTFDWGKVGTWPGDRLFELPRKGKPGRPRKARQRRQRGDLPPSVVVEPGMVKLRRARRYSPRKAPPKP